ncbi:TetR/AcrR family transcriptional regulator [Isoptericola sp. NPDC019482]|uniref:TetR/AcrR family transcriptional regulator n=1 Tax=Isoptericola sp. NPDC019482 TaxID=3154688 RepID=UPI003498E4AF
MGTPVYYRGVEATTEDKRVRRSRAALVEAAIRLVTERETAAISVTELTDAADVSRKLLYQHFGDRDALLVAATVDFTERALSDVGAEDPVERMVALTRHLAEHRAYYRAIFSGPCAFAASEALKDLFSDLNRSSVGALFGDLDRAALDDMRLFFAAGVQAIVRSWITSPRSPADPDELDDRLRRVATIFAESINRSATSHQESS